MSAHTPGLHRPPSMTDEQKLAKLKSAIRLAKGGFPQSVVLKRTGLNATRGRQWAAQFGLDWPFKPRRKGRSN